MIDTLRTIGPVLLALLTTLAFDWSTRRRGLDPPGFGSLHAGTILPRPVDHLRRGVSLAFLFAVLWIGVFLPLGALGIDQEVDLSTLTVPQLFLLHGLLLLSVGLWYACGFLALPAGMIRRGFSWKSQLGLRAPSIRREIGIGLIAGVAAWLIVLGALIGIGLVIWWVGGEELLPKKPPAMIPWIASLPIILRLLISLSAGVVEEVFFRGLLQPRIGIAASSALFVLAHASYEQPLMLVGITILSVIYGFLALWRQNIWPAIAAHFLFDSIQLLLVIPTALDFLPEESEGVLVPVASVVLDALLGAV